MATAIDELPVHSWLTDMDGVLVHEQAALPGAVEFIEALQTHGRRFLVLTNNSIFTPPTSVPGLSPAGWARPRDPSGPAPLPPAPSRPGQPPGPRAYVTGGAGLPGAGQVR